jgi:hypothetical protein
MSYYIMIIIIKIIMFRGLQKYLFIYLTETETTVYGGNYSTVHEYY